MLASGRNVNILVLDTEVYSNTGGQTSKSTPIGAVAKFATAGKAVGKKDIALQAISYGNVYVARIAMGANPQQTLLAFREAEAYDGPSLILAYSHCIAHGINMQNGLDQQSMAVHSGYWPLLRYNPEVRQVGREPVRPRLAAADAQAPRLHRQRAALPDAAAHQSEGSRPADADGAGGGRSEVEALRGNGDARLSGDRCAAGARRSRASGPRLRQRPPNSRDPSEARERKVMGGPTDGSEDDLPGA